MFLNLKTTLYHGTASKIQCVDVTLGQERKDFGKGFYMAVSKNQAIGMMHKKYRESVRRSRKKDEHAFSEKLYEITLDKDYMLTLQIKVFYETDLDWIDFVLM